MEVKFKATIISVGNSYGITIPAAFFDNDYLKLGVEYRFVVVGEVEQKNSNQEGDELK